MQTGNTASLSPCRADERVGRVFFEPFGTASESQVTLVSHSLGYQQRLELLGCLEEAHGVDGIAVATDFVVQMRAGGAAC